ncbi:MAG TPA: serine O-acetyltransferase [Sedimenticola sp.]|nr:serine O-acetyltransferase [Sedimenticola sp.]
MAFWKTLGEDLHVVFERDPAARTRLEVTLCYPGVHALWLHRLAHGLWRRGMVLLPRLLSHTARFLTGIEIHPAARIGHRVFIDHGAGVVIGETAEVGDNCVLYQGVTLGGVSLLKEKRHPTLEDHVVVGAGAKILGPIRVGHGARIGANSVVIRDVEAGATVVGIPARQVQRRDPRAAETITLHHERIPDPVLEALAEMQHRIDALERESSTDPEASP